MIEPLQEFDFEKSNYERPSRKWVCGWASKGEPCQIGPDSAGGCQAFRECIPHKEGDRYCCARPREFGGKCGQGPHPDGSCSQRVIECQPRRSLLARRQLAAFAATALTIGACMVMLGGSRIGGSRIGEPSKNPFHSPGPLISQHHSAVQKCAHCHTAAEGDFAHWIHCALDAEMTNHDDQRCLKCHTELGPNPLLAHGMDRQKLEAIREGFRSREDSPEVPPEVPFDLLLAEFVSQNHLPVSKGELACALCHHEHRGRDADLTQMSNAQCQSCHAVKFQSFRDGHPPFSGYPYKRRTRLHFDHATHYRVHFANFQRVKLNAMPPDELKQLDDVGFPSQHSCNTCHLPDASGRTIAIRGFEQSCGSCHGPEIEEDALPGIPFFAVPRLDVEKLEQQGIHIGQWPSVSGGSTNDSLPPFMELLLCADPDLSAAREIIRKNGWKHFIEQDPQVVERYLWGIKRLVHELVKDGAPALQQRLAQTLSAQAMPSELAVISGQKFLEHSFLDALEKMKKHWFPKLVEEIKAQKQGMQIDSKAVDAAGSAPTAAVSAGWYVSDAKGSDADGMIRIRYRVTGHADRLAQTWLDVISRMPHLLDETGPTASDDESAQTAPLPRLRALSALFGILSDPSASFRCLGCHAADKQTNGSLQINWSGRKSNPHAQAFTKFSHAPHVKLLSSENCAGCHRLQNETKLKFVRPEFVRVQENWTIETNPHVPLTSGFQPVKKQTCSLCHQSQQVGDRCLKCHNYHIFTDSVSARRSMAEVLRAVKQ